MKSRFDIDIVNFDIEPVIQGYTNQYGQNNNSYFFDCPYCGKANKFYVQKQYKYYICFVCEQKGSVYKLVSLLKDITTKEAYKLIHGFQSERLKYNEELVLKLVEGGYYEDTEKILDEVGVGYKRIKELSENHEAREYLYSRDITDEMIEVFDLRYSENDRIVFPVYFRDKIVGYQARDITGFQKPKILSSIGFPKDKIFYNYNQLYYNLPSYVVLVEGPIDCIKAYKHNAVALFGNRLSQDQLNLLMGIASLKRIYIALDPQEEEMRKKLLIDLSAFWETLLVEVEEDKDLGMYSPYEIDMLVKRAKSVFDFEDKIIV